MIWWTLLLLIWIWGCELAALWVGHNATKEVALTIADIGRLCVRGTARVESTHVRWGTTTRFKLMAETGDILFVPLSSIMLGLLVVA